MSDSFEEIQFIYPCDETRSYPLCQETRIAKCYRYSTFGSLQNG